MPTKLPLKQRLGGAVVDEHAVAAVARDQVALGRADEHARRGIVAAGRLTADEIPRRAVGDEDAVLRVAACERAAGIRADVIHGDLIVVGPVDPDAVAAVAADDVGELEAGVDRRLVRERCPCRR